MRARYRIVVCGPGGAGGACIRAALKLAEVELVGVLVYSDSRAGKDVGDVLGIPRCGVKTFKDRSEIYRLQPDCVLYTAKDFGNWNLDEEIIDLLEHGIDVIAAQPFQYLKVRGPEVVRRFEEACRKGGSTLYGSGVNPGFMFERLALTATGASNNIKLIQLDELIRVGMGETEETMQVYGFGIPLEAAKASKTAVKIAEQYERQFLFYAGDVLGMPIDHLEQHSEFKVTPVRIQAPTMVLEPNTVAYATHAWSGTSKSGTVLRFQPTGICRMSSDRRTCRVTITTGLRSKASLRCVLEWN